MAVDANGQGIATYNKPITEIKKDIYYVVIMIDAAHPEVAFKTTSFRGIKKIYHNPIPPGGDPGHALYYVVKNGVIKSVLSLGPRNPEHALNGVRGLATADCSMKAMCYAFRFILTKEKALKLINETVQWRNRIEEGEEKYNALVNDTCAATVVEILRSYLPNLPNGKGSTGAGGFMVNAITPYWLFDGFKKAGTPYRIYPTNKFLYTKDDPKKLLPDKYKIFYACSPDEVLW